MRGLRQDTIATDISLCKALFGDFVPVIVYSFFHSAEKSFTLYLYGLTLIYTVTN